MALSGARGRVPLAYRTTFYDADEVCAIEYAKWKAQVDAGDFNSQYNYGAVARAESCLEPDGHVFPGNPRKGWASVQRMRQYRTEREKLVVDPSENEIMAMEHAAQQAGEFMGKMGKTDLAAMTGDEYMAVIEACISAFQDKLAELHSPYAPITSADCPF